MRSLFKPAVTGARFLAATSFKPTHCAAVLGPSVCFGRLLKHNFATQVSPGIVMAEIKGLRERTGAPIKECKKALNAVLAESGKDGEVPLMEMAVDWLRSHGVKVAAKKSGQTAANGFVSVVNNGSEAAIVEVNCVTDFVEKNSLFIKTVENITNTVALSPESLKKSQVADDSDDSDTDGVSAVMSQLAIIDFESGEKSGQQLGEALTDIISSIRENLVFRRFAKFEAGPNGILCHYVHSRSTPLCGMKGGIVHLQTDTDLASLGEGQCDALRKLGTDIAMHAVTNGNRPICVEESDLSQSALDREKKLVVDEIMAKLGVEAEIPAERLLQNVEGRMRKFVAQQCLTLQTFCLADDKRSEVPIAKLIDQTCKPLGIQCRVEDFAVFTLGEACD